MRRPCFAGAQWKRGASKIASTLALRQNHTVADDAAGAKMPREPRAPRLAQNPALQVAMSAGT
jgi:hypothetical protein